MNLKQIKNMNYEQNKSVEICFPYSTMGIGFAIVEIAGGVINFAEEPIIERNRTTGELDWFNYTIAAGLCVAILVTDS